MKAILRFAPVLMLLSALVGITTLALTPHAPPLVEHIWDKANHWAAFLVLALLLDYSFPRSAFNWRKWLLLLSYGLLIEVGQSFSPSRHFSWFDLVADGVGVMTYAVLAARFTATKAAYLRLMQ